MGVMSGGHPWFRGAKKRERMRPTRERTLAAWASLTLINNRIGKGLGRPNIGPIMLHIGSGVCDRSFVAFPPNREGCGPRMSREVSKDWAKRNLVDMAPVALRPLGQRYGADAAKQIDETADALIGGIVDGSAKHNYAGHF